MKTIAIIGGGFAGLSAASYLAKNKNYKVHIFEKNAVLGGRARQLKTNNGYSFDMGPSWYWMPDVYENYFKDFNYLTSDFYTLIQLNPSFEIILKGNEKIQIPANFDELITLFEKMEKGSGKKLIAFMHSAEKKYNIAFEKFIHNPSISWLEFMDISIIKNIFRLNIFSSFSTYIRTYFKHPTLLALMEFPVLFLGAMPQQTPALYSLMNYAGLKLGTYYPLGGFHKVIESMIVINKNLQVEIHTNEAVEQINIHKNVVQSISLKNKNFYVNAIISTADYNHTEQKLLTKENRNYTENYWGKKVFAPSCLIFYIGINKKLENLQHHTLFFENDLIEHATEIYKTKTWPQKPLFYVCCTSKTDDTVAPKDHENIFLLMPIAVGLQENETIKEKYFLEMMNRLEKHLQTDIIQCIDYKKSYCTADFMFDYNAYKGNGYGLANTLQQTAILKPTMINKKIKNLFYAGQLTVPGPGVPPCIISGKIAANLLMNYFNKN